MTKALSKAAVRRPYLDQVEAERQAFEAHEQVTWISLCSWCRHFHNPEPSYEYPNEDNSECRHPLAEDEYGPDFTLIRRARINTERVADGYDCWAFQPVAGASDDPHRRTTPDLRYPSVPHYQVPGTRLSELINTQSQKRGRIRAGNTLY